MIVGVAFCPHPPALVPDIGRGVAALEPVRAACAHALDALHALGPQQLIVLGPASASAVYPASAWGTLAAYGVDVSFDLGGARDPAATLPLSLTVGAYLLAASPGSDRWPLVTGRSVATGDKERDAAERVDALELSGDAAARPTALLIMGDGSARRDTTAPGYVDERAVPFDDAVESALRDGDAAALAALDEDLAGQLLVGGVAAWRVAGSVLSGQDIDARAHLSTSPFGVAYFVASWRIR